MINRTHIRIAEYIIDTSQAVETLTEGIRRDNRGRKTDLNRYRLLLIGGCLSIGERRSVLISDIHETLTTLVPNDEQFRLGIRWWKTDREGQQVEKMLSVSDLYNVSRRLSDGLAYGRSQADLTDDERERRHHVLQKYCDDVMDVFDLGYTSSTYAVDASGWWTWDIGSKGIKDATNPADDDGSGYVA